MRFKVDTEVSDLRMVLDDQTEVPAEVVLHEPELDLSFIRPKTALVKPMTPVDLSVSGTARVLDEVITLNRLGKAADRVYAVSVERISAIIEQPHRGYVPMSGMTMSVLGSPAFTLDGKLLGLLLVRAGREAGGSAAQQSSQITGIILPAEAVLKASRQVGRQGPARLLSTEGAAEKR